MNVPEGNRMLPFCCGVQRAAFIKSVRIEKLFSRIHGGNLVKDLGKFAVMKIKTTAVIDYNSDGTESSKKVSMKDSECT